MKIKIKYDGAHIEALSVLKDDGSKVFDHTDLDISRVSIELRPTSSSVSFFVHLYGGKDQIDIEGLKGSDIVIAPELYGEDPNHG